MEDRPRFQTGPREIRPSGIIGGPRETWPGWNCAPTSHTERARMVTLHLYTGAPELYPNNPHLKLGSLGLASKIRRRLNWRHSANLTNSLIGKQIENETGERLPSNKASENSECFAKRPLRGLPPGAV